MANDGNGGRWLNTLMGQNVRVKRRDPPRRRVTVIEAVEPPHSPPPVYTRHAFIEMFLVVKARPVLPVSPRKRLCARSRPDGDRARLQAPFILERWGRSGAHHADLHTRGLDRFFEASDKLLRRMPPDTADPEMLQVEMERLREECGLEHVAPPPG